MVSRVLSRVPRALFAAGYFREWPVHVAAAVPPGSKLVALGGARVGFVGSLNDLQGFTLDRLLNE